MSAKFGALAIAIGMQSSDVAALTVSSVDTVSNVSGVSADTGLPVTVSVADLLQGSIPDSNLSIVAGAIGGLTDGLSGETDFDPDGRVIAAVYTFPWELTFTGLGGVDLGELRVFSWNTDSRAEQKYNVSYSTDGGSLFSDLILGVEGGDFGESVLTRVFDDAGGLLATGVTDLRFSFLETKTSNDSTAIIEIDAFSDAPSVVSLPASLSLLAGSLGLLGLLGWRRTRPTTA
ncbi:hypothetical protein [Roseisalinus antarcticus]|nr:hypothetical protein [Roseisalinus antarcticus]